MPALVFPQCSLGKSAGASERSAARSDEGRPLELFNRRGGGRLAGCYKLLGRQFRLGPREGWARGEGVGRGELLVTQREREDRGGPLLLARIFGEARADPAQGKKLERDGLCGVRALERLVKPFACLGAVSQRECRKTDAAERPVSPQRWLLSEKAS